MILLLVYYVASQMWDLLWIMVYGFKGIIEDFTTDHPGYYINHRWLNGSAVETLAN